MDGYLDPGSFFIVMCVFLGHEQICVLSGNHHVTRGL